MTLSKLTPAALAAVLLVLPAAWAAPPLGLCIPCEVISVHDGDTAKEVILSVRVTVRYDDCWAPELSQPGGKASAASAKLAEGRKGRLYIPIDNANNLSDLLTFGRVVGSIWLDGEDESESQRQVRLGFATEQKPKP